MNMLPEIILVSAGAALLVVVAVFLLLGVRSRRPPANLGVHDGKLAECPGTPNCVSSQTSLEGRRLPPLVCRGDCRVAMDRLVRILEGLPRTRIVTRTPEYVHAEFTSFFFRFVDDVELLLDAPAGVIHFRSASRVGRGDLGANRRRLERIRRLFEEETGS